MPEYHDAEAYQLRAKMWHERAGKLSHGEERDVYLLIAEGYAQLAQLIEQRTSVNAPTDFNPDPAQSQGSTTG